MSYSSVNELPQSVRSTLPLRAQQIYMQAFNNAWEHYALPDERPNGESRAEAAQRVAWDAVRYSDMQDGETRYGESTPGPERAAVRPAGAGR